MTARPLMLLDTASLYYRAFFGVPSSVKDDAGRPVNAARGLVDIIAKLVATYGPGQLVACWDDAWRPDWRVALVPTYKAHRALPDGSEDAPSDLTAQLPLIRAALDTLQIPIVGAPDAEADDVIATLAARAHSPVDIVTGDRDLFQLIDDSRGVRVISTTRGMSALEVLTDGALYEKYGVTAAQYADFATLRGDTSDGLPGVRGIGEKTAATLIERFGTLAAIREAVSSGGGLTKAQAARIAEAADYLDAAPTVVAASTSVEVAEFLPREVPIERDVAETLRPWGEEHGLGTSWGRVLDALAAD